MTAEQVAQAHYDEQVAIAQQAASAAQELWRRVSPDAVAGSWLRLLPVVRSVVAAAQVVAATPASQYLTDLLGAFGLSQADAARLDPSAFAGASDGRDLGSLLYQPAIRTLATVAEGEPVSRALAVGGAELDMIVRTQVADAGRAADGVALVATPQMTGYLRMLNPPSCDRCVVLAGRRYRWNDGFLRHPRCDCRHIPTPEDALDDARTDPGAYFDSLTEAEQDRAFTRAGAEAIRQGADIARVVNARRGVYAAAGRKFTREATTRRGRLPGQTSGPRLMPEQIYAEAGDDRAEAVRLLRLHGYLVGDATPRRRIEPATPVDPLARYDLGSLLDGELFALWERHADDQDAADRIGAELDRRDAEREDQGAAVEDDIAADDDPMAAETLADLDDDLDEADRRRAEEAAQAARELRIDQLVARGWEYREAYAEVYDLDADELLRQERQAAVDADRRAGETREQAVRRQYAEWVRLQYLAAEDATRGHLLTHEAQAKGIDALTLFSGPAQVARANASEDLKAWWAENGGRRTYTEFRAEVLGRASDIAEAERIRGRGNDRNFGL